MFVGTGSWSYYARPRLGLEHEFTVADIEAAAARKRELGQPESFEWVHETTPSLLAAARAAGLDVLEAPLMVLDRSAWRSPEPPPGSTLRSWTPTIPRSPPRVPSRTSASARRRPGLVTACSTAPARKACRSATRPSTRAACDFLRERIRRGLTVMAIADGEYGPAAAGQHQPVDGVTEVVGVATLPAVRRQGLGGAVTGALVEHALDRGAGTVFLSAGSDDIARVYGRLGFRRVATACIVG